MTEKPFEHRQFMARARPKDRGPIRCEYPGCDRSFADERACAQHRFMAHNESTPIPSTEGK